MKLALKLIVLFILPVSVFAQNPAFVKQQATVVANALFKSDYKTIVDHTYPKAVAMGGGKEKMLQMMTTGINQMKAQGFVFEKVTIGTAGKFYKAGNEIHCIIPESLVMKTPQGRFATTSSLLCVSGDGGKNWSFLDLNRGTINSVKTLFPNFNSNLVIPTPQVPTKL
ncbi:MULTISPECIES: hypothetical protein [unclassified Mucilaginibacter]|uniref:hypothetical protein n=1 Tax=unclassified Mucilaginibacter TaxID=2617802 RepID=UPI002AC9CE19|nr:MULTISPECIES: hypothetical protein [unclassified Mucilaginibacter]MEB0262170.1 hypothetical protein [Mucilaginibacter sp. 10I4]MEB0277030.1 hypothetical protein [Mucilaginibacter sp. 10B2]MEB0302657.1 hypothetical protein [Mucilaginibacter sp. 5C4]WPX25131.1 hypothetical protein RHM67_07610 [Mucilaginibacter sp. 5C4]